MREGLRGHCITSESNRRRLEHWTWTPPSLRGRVPVLVLLHGAYEAGGYCWWHNGHADRTAASMVDAGAVPPFCLVMPGDTGAGWGTGYCDWHDGSARAETYIMRELLAWIDSELPGNGVLHIGGLSMGGYGALTLALRNPGVFRSASATSAFFDPLRLLGLNSVEASRIWGPGDAALRAHDPRLLVEDPQRRRDLRIAFDCGIRDDLIEENRSLHAQLQRGGIAHGYVEHPGGHDWDYWAARVAEHLRFHLATD